MLYRGESVGDIVGWCSIWWGWCYVVGDVRVLEFK